MFKNRSKNDNILKFLKKNQNLYKYYLNYIGIKYIFKYVYEEKHPTHRGLRAEIRLTIYRPIDFCARSSFSLSRQRGFFFSPAQDFEKSLDTGQLMQDTARQLNN